MENEFQDSKKKNVDIPEIVSTNPNLKFASFSLYNGLNLIYGVNGIGKSSWVKNIKTNDFLLNKYNIKFFDEDYILNHVYISDNLGYKSVSTNEINRASVYIGNDIKKKYEMLSNFNKKLKEIKQKLVIEESSVINELKKFLKEYEIENDDSLTKFKQQMFILVNSSLKNELKMIQDYNYNFTEEEFENWIVNTIKNSFNNFDYNFQEVDDFVNEFKYRMLLQSVSKNILENLDDFIEMETGYIKIKIDKKINDFIVSNKVFLDFLNRYKKKNIILNDNENKWVLEGIKIHSKSNKCICLFCLSTSFKNQDFRSMLNSEIEKWKEKVNIFLKNIYQLLFKFENYKKMFINQNLLKIWDKNFEKLFIFLMKLYENIKIIKENIDNNETITEENLKIFNIPIDNLLIDNVKKIVSGKVEVPLDFLKKFLVESKYSKFRCFYLIHIYKKIINKINLDIEYIEGDIAKNLEETDKKISEYYTEYERLFNLNFNFNIKLERPRNNALDKSYKLVLKDCDNKDGLKYLSTGERRKLSLIIFLSEVEYELANNNEKKTILVFDDPIDSSDFFTYLSFKNIIIKKIMSKNKYIENVVILTHNIDYVFTQLINSEKENVNDIHLFKIKKNCNINREIVNINYKQELLNDNQIFLKCFEYLYNCIKSVGTDNYNKEKLIFFLYCFYALIVRKIEIKCLDTYFSISFKKLIKTDNKEIFETLKEKLNNENNFKKVHYLYSSLRKCTINNNIWKELLSIYTLFISSFSSIKQNEKLEELKKLNIEEIIIENDFQNQKIKEIVNNFKPNNHIESVIKLIGIVNIFKNDFQKGSISRDLASFVRHSNNNIFKPLIALEDIFSFLEIEIK